MNQIVSFLNTSLMLNKSNKQESIKTNNYILNSPKLKNYKMTLNTWFRLLNSFIKKTNSEQ